MKKKNLTTYLLVCGVSLLVLGACKKSFLESKPDGLLLESNYYSDSTEALSGLTAAYNPLGWEAGSTDNTYISKLGALNSGADECYAGGGGSSDIITWQAMDNYAMLTPAVGPQAGLWDRNYTGIYRVNVMLSKLGKVPGLDVPTTARLTAEVKFLRAYYYFDLVRLFKNIPLIIAPIPTADIFNQLQVKPEVIYAQIEKDLKEAIPNLPAIVATTENGRASKGAGNALLGKVILFQNNTSRMQEAADALELVNSSPNYHLLANYPDIFNPDNKFNAESVFEITHTAAQTAGWGNWPGFLGNVYVQTVGARSYSGPIYLAGYGFNPIRTDFAMAMKSDPRYPYTIINIDSLTKATPGASYDNSGFNSTGYYIQKYAPLARYKPVAGDGALNFPNDYIEIRLADTFLMEAEALVRAGGNAAKAQSYLDKVRARVGLASIPVTLDNIYNERKMELATEGHRWFDLVRTGKAATVLAAKKFKAGVNEILPIPLYELNNTKLVQNPGYN
jgi:hypothetical protein